MAKYQTSRGQPLALTEEQRAVVASNSPALRVVAFAGAGKTSTLRAYAETRPGERFLYVAFNAAVAKDARASFPAHVTCSTMHALAYRAVGRRYQHKLRTSLRAHQAARALGLNPAEVSDLSAAERALVALRHFLSSDAGGWDVFRSQTGNRYGAVAIAAAARLWTLMVDPHHRLPMLHDGYLKLFQLSNPQLGYGVVLFDEAQDANPVTLAILRGQSSRRVYVGDPHQQIYQFRYAINGMAAAELEDELYLSESFRYGEELAAAANRLLTLKGETRLVRGGRRGAPSTTKAFIARGNVAIYRQAVELAARGERAHWVGGLQGYRLEQLLDVWRLRYGHREEIRDPFLAGFLDYEALCAYVESQDQRDLKAWLGLLERHERCQSIPSEIERVQALALDQPAAGVTSLCTAHKSKGLEFGVVTLADDFPSAETLPYPPEAEPGKDPEGFTYSRTRAPRLWAGGEFLGAVVLPEEELNLRYVAVTRAEAECHSASWPAPMFSELETYRRGFPRCLLLDSLETVIKRERQKDVETKVSTTLPLMPELRRAEEVKNLLGSDTGCPTCPKDPTYLGSGGSDIKGSGELSQEEASTPNACRQGFSWQLGALDPVQLRVVVAHYRHRYPALDWGWLLPALAELRLVGEPRSTVTKFLAGYQLGSAQSLIERFVQDVGLWVVEQKG